MTNLSNPDNILQSLLVLSCTIIIAWLVKIVFGQLLKALLKKTKTVIDDEIIKSLENPVFWSIILAGGYIFLNNFNIPKNYFGLVSNLLKTAAVIVWALATLKVATILIIGIGEHQRDRKRIINIIPFLKTISKLVSFTIMLILTFEIWKIDITPLLASAGIAGFAIAFAAKDTVSNLFGGISVFLDKPYSVKDYVIIDDKYRGEVIEIGIRSTKIRTRDDVLLTVPNSVMTTKAVINETGLDGKLRVRVPLGIAPGTDLDKSEKIIVKILKSHPEVLKVPSPRIRYRKFGDFTIDLEALFVISNPANRGRITHELIKRLDKGLRKENVELPLPQMVVNLDKKS
ncbi:mechanosensitive ion channel family protein [Patescibacteria group bacterium]